MNTSGATQSRVIRWPDRGCFTTGLPTGRTPPPPRNRAEEPGRPPGRPSCPLARSTATSSQVSFGVQCRRTGAGGPPQEKLLDPVGPAEQDHNPGLPVEGHRRPESLAPRDRGPSGVRYRRFSPKAGAEYRGLVEQRRRRQIHHLAPEPPVTTALPSPTASIASEGRRPRLPRQTRNRHLRGRRAISKALFWSTRIGAASPSRVQARIAARSAAPTSSNPASHLTAPAHPPAPPTWILDRLLRRRAAASRRGSSPAPRGAWSPAIGHPRPPANRRHDDTPRPRPLEASLAGRTTRSGPTQDPSRPSPGGVRAAPAVGCSGALTQSGQHVFAHAACSTVCGCSSADHAPDGVAHAYQPACRAPPGQAPHHSARSEEGFGSAPSVQSQFRFDHGSPPPAAGLVRCSRQRVLVRAGWLGRAPTSPA